MDKTINKGTATLFHTAGKPYTSISNAVVESIVNPTSLAIWTYLQTKDNQWTVVAGWLQKRFGLSRERYREAMRHLQDLGLLQHKALRDPSGKLVGTRIIVNFEPIFTDGTENRTVGIPDGQKTERTGNEQQPIKDSLPIKESNLMVEQAFNLFWSAGMVKQNKKGAFSSFSKIIKKSKADPMAFAEKLVEDIKKRLSNEQRGFRGLHPTTYLNGERWNDEYTNDAEPKKSNVFDNWYMSDQGIARKAQEMGVQPRPTESYRDLADRLKVIIANGGQPEQQQTAAEDLFNDLDIPY